MAVVLERGRDYERVRSFCKKDYIEKYNELIEKPQPYFSFNIAVDFVKAINNPSLHIHTKESKDPEIVGIICASPLVGTEREQSEKLEFMIAKETI